MRLKPLYYLIGSGCPIFNGGIFSGLGEHLGAASDFIFSTYPSLNSPQTIAGCGSQLTDQPPVHAKILLS